MLILLLSRKLLLLLNQTVILVFHSAVYLLMLWGFSIFLGGFVSSAEKSKTARKQKVALPRFAQQRALPPQPVAARRKGGAFRSVESRADVSIKVLVSDFDCID